METQIRSAQKRDNSSNQPVRCPITVGDFWWTQTFPEMSSDLDLEQELQLELAKLDQMFFSGDDSDPDEESQDHDHHSSVTSGSNTFGKSSGNKYDEAAQVAFELAEAEIEKEELQDKLRLLLSKTEDFDSQLMQLHTENQDLFMRYTQVIRENERLKQEAAEMRQEKLQAQIAQRTAEAAAKSTEEEAANATARSGEDFEALEFKLAETRAKLARYQQNLEDLTLAKDFTVKELEKERMTRIHIEKERDAYSAAYEASLQHLNKWAKAKAINSNNNSSYNFLPKKATA